MYPVNSLQSDLSVYQQRSLQSTEAETGCCSFLGSLLEKIAKVFSDVFEWVKSLFCKPAAAQQTPTLNPARVTPVAQRATTDDLLNFYRSPTATDNHGRNLTQIWNWDDNQLEAVHNYIQWLFPNARPSGPNPTAPLINDEMVQAFASDPVLRNNLHGSFLRMLRFYGLQLDETTMQITRAPNAAARQAVWLTPGNHNHLRITRILFCLNALGLQRDAQAFIQILNDLSQNEGRNAIDATTLQYWRNAARV
ncbi:MAG: opioid growth factor receptor-related protein [Parachlamydiales bacterium]